MVSVAEVAAVISASIVIVQLSYPLLLSLITVGTLKKSNNAATFSVLGRLINGSLWPYILRTDTASRFRVDRRVQSLSALSTLTRILLAITATVTPLGLRSTLKSRSVSNVPFSYVADDSPMGQATPPRDGYVMNRKCGGGMLATPCPGNDDGYTFTRNATGEYLIPVPGRENASLSTTIAPNLTAIFSGGMGDSDRSIARVLDIQWRSFINYNNATVPRDDENVQHLDRGETQTRGKFRYIQQILSENTTRAVEGLIVSMGEDPGIGFRNHTLPPTSEFGCSWTEDLLRVTPETACEPLNITFQYSIPPDAYSTNVTDTWSLVDEGAFSNIPAKSPDLLYSSQGLPQLRERAWQAATMTNKMIARWLNVSRTEYQTRRVYSLKGPLPIGQASPEPGRMYFSNLGRYNFPSDEFKANLPGPLREVGNRLQNLTSDTWSLESYAKGYSGGDKMNILTIGMVGGLMLGLGQIVNENGLISSDTRDYSMNPGTTYSHSLLACMSAIKASVRTVHFRLNGTALVSNLVVADAQPVTYSSQAEWPTWAMEKSDRNISEFNPFWGVIPNSLRDTPGLDVVKRPDFYIPAGMNSYWSTSGIIFGGGDGAAGTDAPFKAFAEVFSGNGGYGKPSSGADYSGADNWFLYMKWMNLSRNQETTGRIIDYVWTDLMANAVVGSTSLLESGNSNVSLKTVTQYYSGVGYDWRYATPAFVMMALYGSLFMFCVFMRATKRLRLDEVRHMLNQTAAGRAMTTERFKASDKADLAPTKEWVKMRGDELVLVGRTDVRMGAVIDRPSDNNFSEGERPEADKDSLVNVNSAPREQ